MAGGGEERKRGSDPAPTNLCSTQQPEAETIKEGELGEIAA